MSAKGVLREFLDWYDSRFPTGQSKQLPGLTLFSIAERAREALADDGPQAPEAGSEAGGHNPKAVRSLRSGLERDGE